MHEQIYCRGENVMVRLLGGDDAISSGRNIKKKDIYYLPLTSVVLVEEVSSSCRWACSPHFSDQSLLLLQCPIPIHHSHTSVSPHHGVKWFVAARRGGLWKAHVVLNTNKPTSIRHHTKRREQCGVDSLPLVTRDIKFANEVHFSGSSILNISATSCRTEFPLKHCNWISVFASNSSIILLNGWFGSTGRHVKMNRNGFCAPKKIAYGQELHRKHQRLRQNYPQEVYMNSKWETTHLWGHQDLNMDRSIWVIPRPKP